MNRATHPQKRRTKPAKSIKRFFAAIGITILLLAMASEGDNLMVNLAALGCFALIALCARRHQNPKKPQTRA